MSMTPALVVLLFLVGCTRATIRVEKTDDQCVVYRDGQQIGARFTPGRVVEMEVWQ